MKVKNHMIISIDAEKAQDSPTTKDYPAPNVSSAEVKKPWPKTMM